MVGGTIGDRTVIRALKRKAVLLLSFYFIWPVLGYGGEGGGGGAGRGDQPASDRSGSTTRLLYEYVTRRVLLAPKPTALP